MRMAAIGMFCPMGSASKLHPYGKKIKKFEKVLDFVRDSW